MPDGASSGKMQLSTDRGISNAIYFELTETAGTRTYEHKRGYQIKYDVNVNVIKVRAETVWLLDTGTDCNP